MTREIKFRAWDGRMLPWGSAGMSEILKDWARNESEKDGRVLNIWSGIHLMQYTGLKDKNGKEIYQGDILRFNDSGYTKFGFGEAIGEVVWVGCSFEVSMHTPKDDNFWDLECNENWEVIGNIYENPELLK